MKGTSMPSRREFVRVEAAVEIAYRVIPEAECEQWESGSLLVSRRQRDHHATDGDYALSRALGAQLDPEVARFLEQLDKKVSCLLEMASRQREEADGEVRLVAASLSGCGISFPSDDLHLQDRVFLTILLATTPSTRLEVVGTVVRVSEEEAQSRTIGIAFEQITEADREAIIRYTFQIQREIAKLHLGSEREVLVEE
jgi:c-di-GMP-binding flagellar brake protein YcgR